MLCDNYQYNQQYNPQYKSAIHSTELYLHPRTFCRLRGQDVVTLQQNLKDRGYSIGRVDGIFGSRTRRAVINYQADNGLNVTGIADVQTLTSLNVVSSYNPYNHIYHDIVLFTIIKWNCYK
jgi:N-acetyl-anhydromuramyl-L-alanine amidase AmpD